MKTKTRPPALTTRRTAVASLRAAERLRFVRTLYELTSEIFDIGVGFDQFYEELFVHPLEVWATTYHLVMSDSGRDAPREDAPIVGYCLKALFEKSRGPRRTERRMYRFIWAMKPTFWGNNPVSRDVFKDLTLEKLLHPLRSLIAVDTVTYPASYASVLKVVDSLLPNPYQKTPPRVLSAMRSAARTFDYELRPLPEARGFLVRLPWVWRTKAPGRPLRSVNRCARYYEALNPDYREGEWALLVHYEHSFSTIIKAVLRSSLPRAYRLALNLRDEEAWWQRSEALAPVDSSGSGAWATPCARQPDRGERTCTRS